MTTLFRSRHDAEEFAARVDATSGVRAVTEQTDARVEQLVGVAASLRGAAASPDLVALATPRPDFALALRERLMTEAATVLTPQTAALVLPPRQRGRRERRLVAAATAAVLLGGTASVAVAAQSALPGEALYPIKRALEQADVTLSGDSAGKGTDLLGHASGRLDEVSGLLAQDSATSGPRIAGTLADFDTEAREGADLLMAAYADDRDEQSIATVRAFTASGLTALERLSAGAPEAAQSQLRDAAMMLRGIDQRATELCAACSDLPPLAVPKILLVSADVERAMKLLDGARLDNSHPVVAQKAEVRQAQTVKRRAASAAGAVGGTGSVTGAAPSTPSASQPAAPRLPAAPRTVVPEVDLEVKADRAGDTVKDVTDQLADGTTTLLPDTEDVTDLLP